MHEPDISPGAVRAGETGIYTVKEKENYYTNYFVPGRKNKRKYKRGHNLADVKSAKNISAQ